MAAPSLTYALTNGTTADASQVMQNFNDILNGITDGSKDLSISALTCAGTATLNGHVNLGNSTADDLTITASLASNLVPKTDATYALGSSAIGYSGLYLSNGSGLTARVIAAAHAADRNYTIPDCGANDTFVMRTLAQTLTNKTLTSPVMTTPTLGVASATSINFGDSTLSTYKTFSVTSGSTATGTASSSITLYLTRIGSTVIGSMKFSFTKDGTTNQVTFGGLISDTDFRPAQRQVISYPMNYNGGASQTAAAYVDTDGDLLLFRGSDLGAFAASGTNNTASSGAYYVNFTYDITGS